MGRWAEVYFTSPPEKRDQAVWDLLCELKAEQTAGAGSAAPLSTNGERVATHPVSLRDSSPLQGPGIEDLRARFSAPSVAEVRPDLIVCSACGFESPARQRFCGMCGTRLAKRPAALNGPSTHLPPAPSAAAETDRHESNLNSEPDLTLEPSQSFEAGRSEADQRSAANGRSEPNQEPESAPSTHVLDEFPWRRDENSLFRIAEEVRPHGIRGSLFGDPADGSLRYRRYLVAAVVVAIFALGYITWRALQNQPSAALPTAPAAQEQTPEQKSVANAVQSAASQVATNQPSAAQPSDIAASVSASEPATAPAKTATMKTKTSMGESTATHDPGQNALTSQPTSTAADSLMPETAESGATDLAMGRSYLNGTNGHERNSTEAADCLWRAVSKKNAEATLLLADLYLRGDGVSKNCDQARVLLDAAARKGSKDAAERLRNLPAFGCE